VTAWELLPIAAPAATWVACRLLPHRPARWTPSRTVTGASTDLPDTAQPVLEVACQACESAPAVVVASFGTDSSDGSGDSDGVPSGLGLRVDLSLCWTCLTPGASAATGLRPLTHTTTH